MDVSPAFSRARSGGVLSAALAVLLTGCAGVEELDAQEAEEHYEAAVADIQEALDPLGYELVLAPQTRSLELKDGDCLYSPGNYEAEGLSADLGAEEGWAPVLEALDPVLAEHGFESMDGPRLEGAVLTASVEDQHGAELSIGATGVVRLAGAHVAATACEGQ